MWVSAVSEPWPVGDAKEEDAYISVHPAPQRLHAPHPGIVTKHGFFECQKVGRACKNLGSLELCF